MRHELIYVDGEYRSGACERKMHYRYRDKQSEHDARLWQRADDVGDGTFLFLRWAHEVLFDLCECDKSHEAESTNDEECLPVAENLGKPAADDGS